MSRKTEAEIAAVVIAILHERKNRRATIADLIDKIPRGSKLEPEDLVAITNPSERKSLGAAGSQYHVTQGLSRQCNL